MNKKAANPETTVRILKNGTCPNLSGKSTLSYCVGVDDTGEIMLQLAGNSNAGYFNNEWVRYTTVQELLAKQDLGNAITSYVLTALFRGKSTNSPSFLFAVLKHEGLVKLSESKKRCYDRCSDAAFLASMNMLIDGKDLPVTSSKGKSGKNNMSKEVERPPAPVIEAPAQEPAEKPLFVLTDVPDSKPGKRGRPKMAQSVVDAVALEVAPAETA